MSAPEFLTQATLGWARIYGDSHVVSTGVLFVHLSGLLLAGGSAVAADRATLLASREDAAGRAAYLPRLASIHPLVIGGLAMMFVSGAMMFLADVETFWGLRVFWVKMTLIAVLIANGYLMQQAGRQAETLPSSAWSLLKVTSVASVVLWFAVLLASTILAGS